MRRWGHQTAVALAAAVSAAIAATAAPAHAAPHVTPQDFEAAIQSILEVPYQPAYVPTGFDTAFDPPKPNTHPTQDYTSGSNPSDPDHPGWPAAFQLIGPPGPLPPRVSFDGARLVDRLAIHPDAGVRPGIVVVHGFNTRAKESVVRWAAMLYKNGYNVLALDQRDFMDEFNAGYGFNENGVVPGPHVQTFGWMESLDVYHGGVFLQQKLQEKYGVKMPVGVFGFSLGGQDTVLAMARDTAGDVFAAGLNFSGPADQNYQIWTTREPPNCQPPNCAYPTTNALVALVVPPYNRAPWTGKYDDPCEVLADASLPTAYNTTPFAILERERAYREQDKISVPLLNFYTADDPLVHQSHANLMAGYNSGRPLQRTFLLPAGNHAYFNDRYWQQLAILRYFKKMLPNGLTTEAATVNSTPGGVSLASLQPVGGDRQSSDALAASAFPVCGAGPTAVSLASVSARASGRGVVVRWRTASEAGTLGFHVYRGGTRVTTRLVRASGTAFGRAYAVRDRLGRTGQRYWLEAARTDGTRARVASVYAR